MKILLLGANGQVGFELWRMLAPIHETIACTRSGDLGGKPVLTCDLEQAGACTQIVASVRPDWVINAAAYTAVDLAETERERAQRINHHAVAELAEACRKQEAKLVHYSTDYVYPGTGKQAWREQDQVAPSSQYGLSKLQGEAAISESACRHLILRTQWLYASRGKNFLRTMLRLGKAGKSLRVVNDQFGAPTPAAWVAVATVVLMQRAEGVLNLSAAGCCTWYEFAKAIFARAGLQVELQPCSTAEYGAVAPRPSFGLLDNQLAHAYGVGLPSWQCGLEQVMSELALA